MFCIAAKEYGGSSFSIRLRLAKFWASILTIEFEMAVSSRIVFALVHKNFDHNHRFRQKLRP